MALEVRPFSARISAQRLPSPSSFSAIFQRLSPGTTLLFVVGLLGLWACRPDHLGKLAHCEAKLDVGFHLTGVQSVALSARWVCELEKAEFNGPFCKSGMEVQHMIPA